MAPAAVDQKKKEAKGRGRRKKGKNPTEGISLSFHARRKEEGRGRRLLLQRTEE